METENSNEPEFEDSSSQIVDDAEKDKTIVPLRYDIASYGADFDVEGFVKRLERGDVSIPDFQRDYVWTINDASRFIESLLLGLPVPGVFLAKEKDSNKLLVIDGQQRLKTLQFFYKGVFNPKKEDKTRRVFKLSNVQSQFTDRTYDELEENDRVKLNDSIIHATIIKQEMPENDDTSIYHVFERLNSGGRKLTAQEIRSALYHGNFIDIVSELNRHEWWRTIFGKPHSRLKDIELIIRFLALFIEGSTYKKPMNEFLNKFAAEYRNKSPEELKHFVIIFQDTINLIYQHIGTDAFKIERGVNAAVFDSVMVGVAYNISNNKIVPDRLKYNYIKLLANNDYQKSVFQSTSDEGSVDKRIELAKGYFGRNEDYD
jgi:uncharacterized protein with ParB-like and HNH nuclease domain